MDAAGPFTRGVRSCTVRRCARLRYAAPRPTLGSAKRGLAPHRSPLREARRPLVSRRRTWHLLASSNAALRSALHRSAPFFASRRSPALSYSPLRSP
jgi:hypothetical protein